MNTSSPGDGLPDPISNLLRHQHAEGSCPSPSMMSAFIQGDISGKERASVVAHLGRCRACADEVLDLRELLAEKTDVIRIVKSPGARRTVRPAKLKPHPTNLAWVYAAAASIAVGLLAWGLSTNNADHPKPVAKGPIAQPPAPQPTVPPVANLPKPPDSPKGSQPDERVEPPADSHVENPKPPEDAGHVAQNPPSPSNPKDNGGLATAPETESRFELAAVLGNTELRTAGQTTWQPLKEGEPTKVAGTVALRSTGGHSARFLFSGHAVSIERDSEVAMSRDAHGCHLSLARGGILADGRDSDIAFVLEAAGARIDAHFTCCDMRLDGKDARIVALDGELPVTCAGGSVSVPQGSECRVSGAKPPVVAKKADLKTVLAWTRELEICLALEPEKGSMQAMMRVVADASASGGSFVTSPRQQSENESVYVEFPIEVKRAGTYRILARVAKGEYKTTNGHFRVLVDGGRPDFLPVHASDDLWRWSEAEGPVELEAGRHVVRICDPWGGHRLDSVMITTDPFFVPELTKDDAPWSDENAGPRPRKGNGH